MHEVKSYRSYFGKSDSFGNRNDDFHRTSSYESYGSPPIDSNDSLSLARDEKSLAFRKSRNRHGTSSSSSFLPVRRRCLLISHHGVQ